MVNEGVYKYHRDMDFFVLHHWHFRNLISDRLLKLDSFRINYFALIELVFLRLSYSLFCFIVIVFFSEIIVPLFKCHPVKFLFRHDDDHLAEAFCAIHSIRIGHAFLYYSVNRSIETANHYRADLLILHLFTGPREMVLISFVRICV